MLSWWVLCAGCCGGWPTLVTSLCASAKKFALVLLGPSFAPWIGAQMRGRLRRCELRSPRLRASWAPHRPRGLVRPSGSGCELRPPALRASWAPHMPRGLVRPGLPIVAALRMVALVTRTILTLLTILTFAVVMAAGLTKGHAAFKASHVRRSGQRPGDLHYHATIGDLHYHATHFHHPELVLLPQPVKPGPGGRSQL